MQHCKKISVCHSDCRYQELPGGIRVDALILINEYINIYSYVCMRFISQWSSKLVFQRSQIFRSTDIVDFQIFLSWMESVETKSLCTYVELFDSLSFEKIEFILGRCQNVQAIIPSHYKHDVRTCSKSSLDSPPQRASRSLLQDLLHAYLHWPRCTWQAGRRAVQEKTRGNVSKIDVQGPQLCSSIKTQCLK